jgi:hypothetical protein
MLKSRHSRSPATHVACGLGNVDAMDNDRYVSKSTCTYSLNLVSVRSAGLYQGKMGLCATGTCLLTPIYAQGT